MREIGQPLQGLGEQEVGRDAPDYRQHDGRAEDPAREETRLFLFDEEDVGVRILQALFDAARHAGNRWGPWRIERRLQAAISERSRHRSYSSPRPRPA